MPNTEYRTKFSVLRPALNVTIFPPQHGAPLAARERDDLADKLHPVVLHNVVVRPLLINSGLVQQPRFFVV